MNMFYSTSAKIIGRYKDGFTDYDGKPLPEYKLHEAFDDAIYVLNEKAQDGCDGCKYINKDQYEMPCLICKKSYQNMWKTGEPIGEKHYL